MTFPRSAVEVEMITVEAFRMLNILDLLSIAQLIMASKAAEDPSDISRGSGNNLKTEEPAAKDSPKNTEGVGNGVNTEEGAQAATSESVGGSEEARTKGGVRNKRSSRLGRMGVVRRQPRSGGFMARFSVFALALTWGMWKLDRLERSQERRTQEALEDKLKKFVHEREALDALMKDVAVIKKKVIEEKVNEKGGFWAIFQRG